MHSGEPLRNDASIRDFNSGIGCHIASIIEEALLLPKDMVIQNTFRLDEMFNNCYNQLEEERKKWSSVVQTLTISEQDLAETKKKLVTEEQARKSADSALEGFQKQAEDQRKHLHEANEELKAAREQVAVLKKHLEETQKLREQAERSREEAERAKVEIEQAMNEAEQKGYDLGMAKTEETLRAEVSMVCRIYCAKTWNEALNRAGVEASSELRKAENVFYPTAIRALDPSSAQVEDTPSTTNPNQEVLPQNLPLVGQPEPAKETNAPQEVSLDKTAAASEAGVASQGFQQDLDSTVMLAEGATKDKEGVTTSEENKSSNQAPKLQIKLKK
ncbi:ankyrin repeat domain-containing protein 30A-like [Quercus lobata]|uniref:ankyrin repeat domain-containing protein 30A-like n=1 Tax=Quercus lobata TaxID=97700 RepID=UPI00124909C5|nr:ankyrin repeat domain-containing protein 30A-like [Quercus lobata]